MTARYLIGDVFQQLATIPDNSVDLVLTSPPFLALRSYLPADHPDKGKEIGSGHGRDATGIDLDERNADLARNRVGMFLEVVYPESIA